MEQTLSFEAAYQELIQITKEIEEETVSIDILAEKVRRASELIAVCQGKLRQTEAAVGQIITQMNEQR